MTNSLSHCVISHTAKSYHPSSNIRRLISHLWLYNNSVCLLIWTFSSLRGFQKLSFNRSEVNGNTSTILTLFTVSHQQAVCHANLGNCICWSQFNLQVLENNRKNKCMVAIDECVCDTMQSLITHIRTKFTHLWRKNTNCKYSIK